MSSSRTRTLAHHLQISTANPLGSACGTALYLLRIVPLLFAGTRILRACRYAMGRGAMVDAQTQALVNQLSAGVTAAVFTPARKDGCIDIDALADYSSRLASSGLAGLAVWAHTGRGLRLDRRCRKIVIDTIRQATTLPLVAGVGVPSEVKVADTNEGIAATVAMAHAAGESGADALMVYPPAFAAGQGVAERASTVRRIHSAVAALGLPVLGFLLYERAGGVSYRDAELAEILCIDGVVGMKVAL